MAKMSNLRIEVEELIRNGYSANEVAEMVGVPVDWVLDVEEEILENQ